MRLAPRVGNELTTFATLAETIFHTIAGRRGDKESARFACVSFANVPDREGEGQDESKTLDCHEGRLSPVAQLDRLRIVSRDRINGWLTFLPTVAPSSTARGLPPDGFPRKNQLIDFIACSKSPFVTLPVVGRVGMRQACNE